MPANFHALPIPWAGNEGLLRIGLVGAVRDEKLAPINIDSDDDAASYLGCVQDAAGTLRQWVELLVQKTADRNCDKWHKMLAAMQETCCRQVLWTGWESTPMPPLQLSADGQSLSVGPEGGDGAFFNAGGGRVVVRELFPVSFEGACDLLGGANSAELLYGRIPVRGGDQWPGLPDTAGDGVLRERTLAPHRGRAGALLESLCLKLRLYAMMVHSVGQAVACLKRPLLNLRPDSFGVRFADAEHNLSHWCFELAILDYGDAQTLPLPAGCPPVFVRSDAGASLYRAPVGEDLQGHCAVRLPSLQLDGQSRLCAQMTLTTTDRFDPSASDVVAVQLELPGHSLQLYAAIQQGAAMAGMESKLETFPQALQPAEIAALRNCEGELLRGCHFRIIRASGAACDLYSLAVLGAREFLVGRDVSLPMAMDRLLSLAQHLSLQNSDAPLEGQLAAAFSQDPRWRSILGPRHLVCDELSEDELASAMPAELWQALLAILIRLLPGRTRHGYCRDYGQPAIDSAETIFATVEQSIDSLRRRCQSLLVGDVAMNHELRRLIEKVRGGART